MRPAGIVWFGLLAACGNVSLTDIDGPVAVDAAVDAGASDAPVDAVAIDAGPCDLSGDFAGLTAVLGAYDVPAATITYDERVIYYTAGKSYQVWRAARNASSAAFGVGGPAPGAPNSVFDPATAAGETVLLMHSGQARLLRMTRASNAADFGDLIDLGIGGVTPFASPRALYFSASGDLYAASLLGGVAGTPARIDELASGEPEQQPVVSADELEIAFRRGAALMLARRATVDGPFADARQIAVPGEVIPAGFSEDRCRLYVTDARGAAALRVLTRP